MLEQDQYQPGQYQKEQFQQEQQQIEQLMRSWIVGGATSLEQLPESWQALLQDEPLERQGLLALALCSQHQALLFEQKSAQALKPQPDLPQLSLPHLPDDLRVLFVRLMSTLDRQSACGPAPLLQLLLQRGFSAHPADWLPSPQDESLPSIYLPWSRWVMHQHEQHNEDEVLNEDSWDEFYPAERLMQLRQMRLSHGDETRNLIEQCADREPAEKRLKIIEVLAINLSEADGEYLKSLTHNRSQKISRLACQLLARLGISVSTANNEDGLSLAQELAEGFDIKQGGLLKSRLLKAQVQIVPRKLKSKKQQAIRSELLQKVLFHVLAGALQLEQAILAAGWQFSANRDTDNQAFVLNALGSLSQDLVQVLLENALSQLNSSDQMLPLIQLFIPRLDKDTRNQLMYQLLSQKGSHFSFTDCLSFSDQPLTELDWLKLTKTPAWKQLQSLIKEQQKEQVYVEHYQLLNELNALGLILPQALAQQALETLTQKHLIQADPALDALKFNAQLNDQHLQGKSHE